MRVEIENFELHAVLEALEVNVAILEEEVGQDHHSEDVKVGMRDILEWSKLVMDKIQKEFNRFQRRALQAKLDQAANEYLELRDAKSNGCCHGMNIWQVDAYDSKIRAAAKKCEDIRAEMEKLK